MIFSAIGETIGKIFGTDKAASSLVDGVKNGLDKLVYTDEEKADDIAKSTSEARTMFIEWMRATSGQNLARRVLAFFIAGIWGSQYMGEMALSVASIWVKDPKKYIDSAKILGDHASQMNGAMMLILGFYFAAPHLGKMVDVAMAKFSSRPGT